MKCFIACDKSRYRNGRCRVQSDVRGRRESGGRESAHELDGGVSREYTRQSFTRVITKMVVKRGKNRGHLTITTSDVHRVSESDVEQLFAGKILGKVHEGNKNVIHRAMSTIRRNVWESNMRGQNAVKAYISGTR